MVTYTVKLADDYKRVSDSDSGIETHFKLNKLTNDTF